MKILIELYKSANAILTGHFIGRSGKHLDTYINKDNIFSHPESFRKTIYFMTRKATHFERNAHNIKIKNLLGFLEQFDYELTIVGKGSNYNDPIAIKIAEQIYNAVTLNFGHTRNTKVKFGWVYIFKPIGKTKPIKIGYTQSKPKDRLVMLNSSTPDEFEIFYAKLDSDCRYIEKSMFNIFEKYKITGEWYDIDCNIAKEKLLEISKHSIG